MKVNKDSLFAVLTKCAGKINQEIKEPNYGGCGVIAAAVAKELKSRNIPVEVVTPVYNTYSVPPKKAVQSVIETNRKLNNSRVDDAGVNRDHLAVRFKLGRLIRTWDTDAGVSSAKVFGEYKRYPCEYPFGEGFTVEEAEALAKDKAGWNSRFDRRQIRKVNRIVKETFMELK
jgi:hypothetical protein